MAAGAVAACLVVAGAHYLPSVIAAQRAVEAGRALAAEIRTLDPAAVDAEAVGALRRRVDALDADLAQLGGMLAGDPLVAVAELLPEGARQVAAARALVAAGRAAAGAADAGLTLADGAVALRAPGAADAPDLPTRAVRFLAEAGPDARRVAAGVAEARTALAAVPADVGGPLGAGADELAAILAELGPLADGLARSAEAVPALAAIGGERRYLVLAQNPAEIRPTGGFIGSFGILVLRDGALATFTLSDVYTLDGQTGLEWQAPPEPLAAHLLGRASWELADANWSPHFPEAAADALRLYTLESGDDAIDGVIALTTYALDHLLEATGPIAVPGTDITVAAGEVTRTAIAATRTEGPDRKRFLGLLADAVLARLAELPPERWSALAGALAAIVRERGVLAWMRDPAEGALLAGTPVAGALRDEPGDHLYLVDANLAPSSKLSPLVTRASLLGVTLDGQGGARHLLVTTWRNDALAPGEPAATLRAASESEAGQYGLYTRLLVPAESELEELTGASVLPVSGPEEESMVAGRLAWGAYLLVAPGEATLSASWVTPGVELVAPGPDAADERTYRLTIQKQPGMGPEPLGIRIVLPAGSKVSGGSPGLVPVDGGVAWDGTLKEDLVLEVRYRR
ncbi:MAG: DUF4012 domain-containing protein [Chloroflexota bacterium]